MKRPTLVLAAALAVTALGACVKDAPPATPTTGEPPPAPAEKVVFERQPDQVWVEGRWARRGGRWTWVAGHAVPARSGMVYVQGQWIYRDGQWEWVPGYWAPARPGYIWVRGHWQLREGGYRWLPGQWIPTRTGRMWVPGRWVQQRDVWIWSPGSWRPAAVHDGPPQDSPEETEDEDETDPPPTK